jgi:hypothetical protein
MNDEKRLAVLIDADNVSPAYIKVIIDEATSKGVVTYKRIYADWTRSEMQGWKSVLLEYSLNPMQQYSYTTGKNSTDAALIIDAMDILYTGQVDGFCLVSSDSDFTRLAARLREAGMSVIGMGEKKTPRPFVTACEEFKFIDEIQRTEKDTPPAGQTALQEKLSPMAKDSGKDVAKDASKEGKDKPKDRHETSQTDLSAIKGTITQQLANFSDEDGWMPVSSLGNVLAKRYPDFDVRNFGYKKLAPFLESLGGFELRNEPDRLNPGGKLAFIRVRPKKK